MVIGNSLSRRDLLATSAKSAAAFGMGSMLASSTALGQARKSGANDRIRIGVIGSGGQGTHDAYQSCRADNVICVALCDVAEFRLREATARITQEMEKQGHKGVKIDHYGDHRHLLDRDDIDAVIIATPDHWHYRVFLDALEAGKHIYEEKPMSYSIEQGMEMVAAARKHPKLTVQIGTQRRSGTQYPKAKKLIDDGVLGNITYARAYDCRNFVTRPDPFAPRDVSGPIDWDRFQKPCEHKVEYDPWRYFAWRWFWDYAGGLVNDVGIHVMDVVHWLTGATVPKSAVCNGGVYGFDYWETPDVVNAVWDYGTHCVSFVSNFTNGFEGDGLTIFGTKATLEVRDHDIYVWEDTHGNRRGHGDKPMHMFKHEGYDHQKNWIKSIRMGQEPPAPVELGFSSLLPSLMANIAYRKNTKVNWDPQAKRVVVGA